MSLHVWNFNREPEVINLCLEIRGKSHAHLICQLLTNGKTSVCGFAPVCVFGESYFLTIPLVKLSSSHTFLRQINHTFDVYSADCY